MTISVCMCTYNGETYIEEQLYSILHQTYVPDEVIIYDDASQDRTAEIIRGFIFANHLETTWKLYENEENSGYPAAFYQAITLCGCELIFLSDQDDIWCEKKLERMREIFRQYDDVQAACCKFRLIDAEGANIHSVMAPSHSNGTGRIRHVTIEDVFYKNEWLGMVIGFRNDWYRNQASERTASVRDKLPHDLLICALASEEGGFVQIDEELACHRRHGSNTGGEEHRIRKLLNKRRKQEEIQKYLYYLNVFADNHVLRTESGSRALNCKRQVMEERLEALRSGKPGNILRWAARNRREIRPATVLCDLLIVKQKVP